MKRTFYTLSAAAALFGAAPALTLAADATGAQPTASCQCAGGSADEHASAAAGRPGVPTSSSDREQEFLQAVWSAP
jgi:hypothetical protein